MESIEQFRRHVKWTAAEKKVARKAFDKAFERQCIEIANEAKRMLENMSVPYDIWAVENYLRDRRRFVDRSYHYSYSDLLTVFSKLMRDGWLNEVDLDGVQREKIAEIKDGAQALARIFPD